MSAGFGWSLLLWWMLATTIAGTFGGLLILIWGQGGLVALCIFGGLYLGVLQGLALQKHEHVKIWRWVLGSGVGWFCAMFIIFLGSFIAMLGRGLNDADTTGWGIMYFAVAGIVFGILQQAVSPVGRFKPIAWMIINAVAWGTGGLVALSVGGAVHESINMLNYVSLSSSYGLTSIAVGVGVGMLVYGILTGFLVGWLSPRHTFQQ